MTQAEIEAEAAFEKAKDTRYAAGRCVEAAERAYRANKTTENAENLRIAREVEAAAEDEVTAALRRCAEVEVLL